MADATVNDAAEGQAPISDILEKIRATEEKVKGAVKDAESQRERTIAEAKREAIEIRERILKSSGLSIEKINQAVVSEIDAERKRIAAASEEVAKRTHALASTRLPQAREKALKEFARAIDDQA